MAQMPEEDLHKLAPKLRMVANGDEVVNTLRAEQSSALAVRDSRLLQQVPLQREPGARSIERKQIKKKRGSLKKLPEDVYTNVFIQLAGGARSIPEVVKKNARGARPIRKQNLVSATLPLNKLEEVLADPAVIAIEDAERVAFIPPVEVSTGAAAPAHGPRRPVCLPLLPGWRPGHRRDHRRAGLRLCPPRLPGRSRPHPLHPHLGPGRQHPPCAPALWVRR
jgi:hypothetical protein